MLNKYILSNSLLPKFIRFLGMGGVAAFANLTTLYIAVEFFGARLSLAIAIAFVVTIIVNFALQKVFTFQDTKRDVRKQFVLFCVGTVIYLVINTYSVTYLVTALHVWYVLAQALITVVLAGLNFVYYNLVVFSRSDVSE